MHNGRGVFLYSKIAFKGSVTSIMLNFGSAININIPIYILILISAHLDTNQHVDHNTQGRIQDFRVVN